MPLSEVEQEYYADLLKEDVEEAIDTTKTDTADTADTIVDDTAKATDTKAGDVKDEAADTKVTDAVADTTQRINKKYISADNEDELYQILAKKHAYKTMRPEEKAMAIIAKDNPGLDENELLFIAAEEYGIGVERPNENDLTDEQMKALKKQDIARKKLITGADAYFKEQAGQIQLQTEDPLDSDEGYKAYQTDIQQKITKQKEQEASLQNTIQQFETGAKSISEIKDPIELDIDEGKLTFDVKFKLDAAKQKELAEKAKQYIPTDEEVKRFTDPTTGKFDFKGYLEMLAPMVFSKEMRVAAIRQALATDRQKFVEETLKNSNLRNNDVSLVVTKDFDIVDQWPFGR